MRTFKLWVCFLCAGSIAAAAALPSTWHVQTSPATGDLKAVIFGDAMFVAVGTGATIIVSLDASDWTRRENAANVDLSAVAYGNGRYMAGGENTFSSEDGFFWDRSGYQFVSPITYGDGLFLGLHGCGDDQCLAISTNDSTWSDSWTPVATNTLLALTALAGSAGTAWSGERFIAVGERGTIITSSDGASWTNRESGTTVTLRALAFHRGQIIAGGDHGTLVASTNGLTWLPLPPASFDITGLASSGETLVGVGSYEGSGRLQVSAEDLTWPGDAIAFSNRLHSVTYGMDSFVAVGDGGLIVRSASFELPAVNEWSKATSGNWEQPHWSLGYLPSQGQGLIAFRNPGWKALAIDRDTTSNHSASLHIDNLLVRAPTGSFNQLLLNYAGLQVPLWVNWNLAVKTNASLVSHHSTLLAARLYLESTSILNDNTAASLNNVVLETSPAALHITNSSLASTSMTLGPSTLLTQQGGTIDASRLQFHRGSTYHLRGGKFSGNSISAPWSASTNHALITITNGHFEISDTPYFTDVLFDSGYLRAGAIHGPYHQLDGHATVELLSSYPATLSGGGLNTSNLVNGRLIQTGGVHTNRLITLGGNFSKRENTRYGFYTLRQGLLISDRADVVGGEVAQSGGTNLIQDLTLRNNGYFFLENGHLITSNTSIAPWHSEWGPTTTFYQTGGIHVVKEKLTIDDGVYLLKAGVLSTGDIEVGPRGILNLESGFLSNSGRLIIHGSAGAVLAGAHTGEQLGQLQITNAFSKPAIIYLEWWYARGATTLRFQDSHDLPWFGTVALQHWHPANDHIFVGANQHGLTSSQLDQVTFVDPVGWPAGTYAAALDANGEIIPKTVAQGNELSFLITNNNVTILAYLGRGGAIAIPEYVVGLPVTGIANGAFSNAVILTAVMIPHTVRTIGDGAFAGCTNLLAVEMGSALLDIGRDAFANCAALASLTIPEGVTRIGARAFSFCGSLTNVNLPQALVSLGDSAFFACSALSSLAFSASLVEIGSYAFDRCTNLAAIRFAGNRPFLESDPFFQAPATVYYLPGTTGWDTTFGGRPTAFWFLPNPVILYLDPGFGFQTNHFGFTVSWVTNASIVLESSTNPHDSVWLPMATNDLVQGVAYFRDPQQPTNSRRFFRVRAR